MKAFFDQHPRLRPVALGALALMALLVATQIVFPGDPSPARGTPVAILFRGAIFGFVTSLFAVGMVLVYRTMRFINFAQGAFGSAAVLLLTDLLVFTDVPFPVALVVMIAASVLLGVIAGTFLLRFFHSSRLFLTVVTITGSGLLFGVVLPNVQRLPFWPDFNELTTEESRQISNIAGQLPFGGFEFHVGSFPLPFGFPHVLALELAAFALVAVVVFLRFTRSGAAVRAMAGNAERASLLGISVGSLSVVVWGIAAGLDAVAAFSTSIAAPDLGTGFQALHLPLAAAVIARFERIGVAVWASILLGLTRAAWSFSYADAMGVFDVLVFVVIAGGLLAQRRRTARSELGAQVSWAATEEPRQIPAELRRVPIVRYTRWGIGAALALLVAFYPFLVDTRRVVLAGVIFVSAIAVLSLVVLTGWAGQVSLGQWAMVAVGAVVGGALTAKTPIPFWFAVPLVMAITAAVSVVVGLPALRIRGLYLLVTTFAFAVAVNGVLFDDRWFGWLKADLVERPTLFFFNFEDEKSMYYLTAAGLGLAIVAVRNLRRSRVGRLLIAVRENEANLESFGVNLVRAKLLAFAVAGALAGLAGVLFAHHQRGVSPDAFSAQASIDIFVAAVIGGVSSPGGALLGTAYFELVKEFASSMVILNQLLTGAAPLLILFMAPGGFISVVNGTRDSVLRIVAQRRRIVVPSLFADYDAEVAERQLIPLAEPSSLSGLAVLPPRRFAVASELYHGTGVRISERLAPRKKSADAAAFAAAATAADEAERERDAVDPAPTDRPTADLAAAAARGGDSS